MDETVTPTFASVRIDWLEALAEHYEAEQDYFEHENEPDTADEWAAKAADVRLEIRRALEQGAPKAGASVRGRWLVPYEDLCDSFRLAMQAEGIDEATIARTLATVEDAAANNLGDD